MKKRFILLATMMWTHVAIAAESKFIDDAPKGFIHVTGSSETHHYIKVNTLTQIQQFSRVAEIQQFPKQEDGKLRHHIWLNNAQGIVAQLEFSTKEEADRVRVKILELMSAKD
jgi:hypothetical protein